MQAWSNDGQIGYVVIIGSRASEATGSYVTSKGGYQPIVYKTTNAGATWSMLPANDFADYAKYRGVWDRMYPVSTNTSLIVPNFANNEGQDVTVDINGNLHLVQNVVGGYSNHTDSLGYSYAFTIGGEQYSYSSGNFNWPVIYDFYTNSAGGWDYHMVDSMYSEGPSFGTYPGASSNPWLNGSDKVAYDARIQVARTADGRKMIYSWSESDTSLLGTKWNVYPDIKMKGFDVTTNMVTGRFNVTQGVTGVDQNSYFHYMCDKAIGSSTACIEMPFVAITSDNSNDGLQPVVDYYIGGAQLCPTDFTTTAMAPTGIVAATKNTVNFDVINYPNPASGATTILVNLTDAKAFDVTIYNAVGQLIDTYKMNGHKGANEIHIDLNNFSSGVYVYNVKVGNASVTKKLIVE
jgi:hypothetical protein